ncbi:MAG: efflux RND transporter periplasmic adaptor subunit [Proteobacteria bacterium]|uniref:efflux RND transporter periplasmic adaptor subunit n=1 Tax=Rudaea sp. TaxID=2136325 RepID=UPI001D4261E2|nr:efflux RND transporter periplasmic adaptor subunit [Pseudomonadota bacterium]MBS0568357.1 efflux RND transporter periplasmic adaptor subunit [Pseudomonadota bacterium]
MPQPDPIPSTPRRGLRLAGIAAALIAAVIVVYGIATRAAESQRLHDWTEAQALPTVAVNPPSAAANAAGLELPGRIEAWQRAPIYARVPGYVREWKYDIGAKVKAGDVLAEVETPDLDQQLAQARADLATAQANASLARTTAQRWQTLGKTNVVARQDVDEKTGDLAAKQAGANSAQANVARLVAMKGFARLTAPFDGTVTARNTDVGALINAGSAAGSELFVVSDTHKVRVNLAVPQNYATSVAPGTKATLSVPEYPGKTWTAEVAASSQAVNVQSGTTQMQLLVDNPDGELLPGGYASVRLDVKGKANVLSVPGSALIIDARGMSVATVDANNKVVVKPVTIARDLGKVVEIGSGLAATDRVIENPPDGVVTGSEVRIAGTTKAQVAENGNAKGRKG